MPARYFAEVSYRGTAYHGWQRQPNALTVQEVIEDTMKKFLQLPEGIVASGRTDTGVHCIQQYFHFEANETADTQSWVYKLNKMLPSDISIQNIRPVRADAHARFDAITRSYIYRISSVKNVFADGLVWQFVPKLSIDRMNEAAQILPTFTDFQALSKVNTDVNHFLCTIHQAAWSLEGNELIFRITANRFLRGMVRAIVGTCVDIGRNHRDASSFRTMLESRDRQLAGPSAPPEGLYLNSVSYPQEIFED